MPAASSAAPRSISSVAIDLLFTTVRAPCARAMSTTIAARVVAGVAARCTCTPRAVSARSSRSSQPSRSASVSRRIAAARSFQSGCAAARVGRGVEAAVEVAQRALQLAGRRPRARLRSRKSSPGRRDAVRRSSGEPDASRSATCTGCGPATRARGAGRRGASGTRGRCSRATRRGSRARGRAWRRRGGSTTSG